MRCAGFGPDVGALWVESEGRGVEKEPVCLRLWACSS